MTNRGKIAILVLVVGAFIAFQTGCKKDENKPLAVLTTSEVSAIGFNEVTTGGSITSDGGQTITQRGVCWSSKIDPTISDSKTNDGAGAGNFVSSITGLSAGTIYYVRAYATNKNGTGYGMTLSFTTKQANLPALTTTIVSEITPTTAKTGGDISSDGGSPVTARGVCWSINSIPTLSDNLTIDGNGTGTFISSITGLIVDTVYYVRAYATNIAGTSYGNEQSFSTQSGIVSLITSGATNITLTSARSGGNIISDGGSSISARGICWSTNPSPSLSDNFTIDGIGLGIFTSNINNLIINTTYYIRAYATNDIGTTYGDVRNFNTLNGIAILSTLSATNITTSTANTGGNITSDGGSPISARGVCWGTNASPSLSDNFSIDGNGIGAFTSNITGLTLSTNYYIRSYATNAIGTTYGNEQSFSTQSGIATLTTSNAMYINATYATSGGNITSDGGASITARGVCWSNTPYPDISNNHTTNGSGIGSFTSMISDLQPSTTYYIRAYATNSIGTNYGNEQSFDTQSGIASLTTTNATNITSTTAKSGGYISSDGGSVITARGVCWSINTDPSLSDNFTVDGIGAGSFISNIIGLTMGTTYNIRSYATNDFGTFYGNQLSFTTVDLPVVSTSPISSIIQNRAVGGGNVSDDGGSSSTVRGVCWSTGSNPTITDNKTIDGSGQGDFISILSNLSVGTTYYVRAYATNDAGTTYGNQEIFETLIDGYTVIDIDGNVYNTVTIGIRVWMAENLKTTTYTDGTPIPNVTDGNDWVNLTTGAYVWYDNDVSWKDIYGAIYNWHTVNTNELCPTGWHVPSDSEWTALSDFLGGGSVAGGKIKSTRTEPEPHPRWNLPNAGASNSSGLTAYAGGLRYTSGQFNGIGYDGRWWSSSEWQDDNTKAWYVTLSAGNPDLMKPVIQKYYGISVRCVKD